MKRTSYFILALILCLAALFLLRPRQAVNVAREGEGLSREDVAAKAARPQSERPIESSQVAPESDPEELSAELRELMASGNVNARDGDGRTALMIASFKRDQNAVEALLSGGADINLVDQSGQDALMSAINGGDGTLALKLLELGANANRIDKSGQSALSFAVGLGDIKLIGALLEKGANPNLVANRAGYTMAMDLAHEGQLESLSQFLAHGARVDTIDSDGNTLTHHAVMSGNLKVVELVLGRGSPLERPNLRGETPLMIAKKYDLPEIVQFLSER